MYHRSMSFSLVSNRIEYLQKRPSTGRVGRPITRQLCGVYRARGVDCRIVSRDCERIGAATYQTLEHSRMNHDATLNVLVRYHMRVYIWKHWVTV